MANLWKCDSCGKETHIYPPTKPIMEEIPHPNDPTQKIQVQKTVKQKRQNLYGQVEEIDIPAVEFIGEKAYLVILQVGDEQVKRDFCYSCLSKILPIIKQTWDTLEKVTPQ